MWKLYATNFSKSSKWWLRGWILILNNLDSQLFLNKLTIGLLMPITSRPKGDMHALKYLFLLDLLQCVSNRTSVYILGTHVSLTFSKCLIVCFTFPKMEGSNLSRNWQAFACKIPRRPVLARNSFNWNDTSRPQSQPAIQTHETISQWTHTTKWMPIAHHLINA